MRHLARHGDQTIHTSKTDADRPQFRARHDPLAELDVARFEGQDRSGPASHGPVQVVLRVRLQARVADFEAVVLEELGDLLRVGLLLVHAHLEGLDASEEQPGVEGREAAPGGVDCEVELFAERGVVDGQDAGHEVVVARQVLGAALVDDVGAEVERVLEQGGEHGVVDGDDGGGVGFVHGGGDGGDVDDLDQGVRGGFEQDHGGLGGEDLFDFLRTGGIDVVHDYAAVRGEVFQQAVGATVEVVACDHLVARS